VLDDKKYADDEKTMMKDIIFCGNPGVGKSTLLSSVTGEVFKSGISWAKGLTRELAWKSCSNLPGYRFADTPGLADIDLAKQAGEAITKALTSAQNGNHEVLLFFVVNDNHGRIRTEDLYTIRNVLDSIKVKGERKENLYSVIVNQMDCLEVAGWKEEGEPMWKSQFFRSSTSVPYPTTSIIFLPRIKELVNKSNGSHDFKGLGEFLLRAPSLSITSVQKIEVGDMMEEMKKLRKSHQEGIKKLEHKMKNQKEEWEKERRDIQRREERYRAKMEKIMEERAQEVRDMRAEETKRANERANELLKMRKADADRYDNMMATYAQRQHEMNLKIAELSRPPPQQSRGPFEWIANKLGI